MNGPEPREGTNLGPWVLKTLVGRGGFGSVWTAEHREWPGRIEAFKFPTGQDALRRLRDEASALRTLDHPNIVRVHDVDTLGPVPYLRMEYLEGGSLEALLARRGRIPPAEAAGIVLALLQGLRFAHEKGVIHRDLKPANVLLGKEGVWKISDFGLAAHAAGEDDRIDSLDSRPSGSRAGAGTFEYMAPEQREGAPPSPRADVYSLGVVFYRMLAGAPPSSLHPPSHFTPGVPARLDAIVSRMLDPAEERYPSAAEVLRDLEAFAAGSPAASDGGSRRGAGPLGEVAFGAAVVGLVVVACNAQGLSPVLAATMVTALAVLALLGSRLSAAPLSSALVWGGITAMIAGGRLPRALFWIGLASILAGAVIWAVSRMRGRDSAPRAGEGGLPGP